MKRVKKRSLLFLLGIGGLALYQGVALAGDGLHTPHEQGQTPVGDYSYTPLDEHRLKSELSLVRGPAASQQEWPRAIRYVDRQYDFRTDTFSEEEKTFTVPQRPGRIIAHAVGVTEILWAICPRERIAAFNDLAADPKYSFIAAEVTAQGSIFRTQETELLIGYRPDLVFTVFYSSLEFKEKLRQANIPYFDLGYFGTMDSIKYQAELIGRLIGEEGSAAALVKRIDDLTAEIRRKLPQASKPPRLLYYDENGYVFGKTSNFTSICELIGAVNVGAEQGVKSCSQVDYETVLKWDPDIILVPAESHLKKLLTTNRVLSHARAVREDKVRTIPGIYLRVDSQFMLLSANKVAGVVYAKPEKTVP